MSVGQIDQNSSGNIIDIPVMRYRRKQSLRYPQTLTCVRVVYAGQLAAYAGERSISVFQLLVSIPATPSVRVAAGAVATYAATMYAVSA